MTLGVDLACQAFLFWLKDLKMGWALVANRPWQARAILLEARLVKTQGHALRFCHYFLQEASLEELAMVFRDRPFLQQLVDWLTSYGRIRGTLVTVFFRCRSLVLEQSRPELLG